VSVFTGVPFAFLFEELLLNSDTICRSGHYIVVYYNASVRNVDKFFRKTSLFTGLWSVLQIKILDILPFYPQSYLQRVHSTSLPHLIDYLRLKNLPNHHLHVSNSWLDII
jgi:hypothetical protein